MSDCKYVVQSFQRRLPSRRASGRHSELWRELWDHYDRLHGRLWLFKVTAHMDYHQLSAGLIHVMDWYGNFAADILAKAGAAYTEDLNEERAAINIKGIDDQAWSLQSWLVEAVQASLELLELLPDEENKSIVSASLFWSSLPCSLPSSWFDRQLTVPGT